MTQEVAQIKKEIERRIDSAIFNMASSDIEQVKKGAIQKRTLEELLSFIDSNFD